MKAEKIGVMSRTMYTTVIEYEYRGKSYCVEYANDRSYCVTHPRIQHENAQARIDKEIEQESMPHNGENAEVGFDLFWNYVNS